MFDTQTNTFTLSKQDTSVMKGIAIIAMLCHHVYTCQPEWVEAYPFFLTTLGVLGKVCVAIFLFCSGYGLAVQYDKTIDSALTFKKKICTTIKFIIKRLIKFYSAYWFVFLIFVPITIAFFDRPLSAPYGESANPFFGVMLDLFGLQGFRSYNITWWFNKLIILLYVVFPILFLFIKNTKWFGLILCFIAMRFAGHLGVLDYYEMTIWQFPFVLGIGWTIYQNKMVVLSQLAKQYFGKSQSWFSQRLNGCFVFKKAMAFKEEEYTTLSTAFRDIANRLLAHADEIDNAKFE